MNTPQRKQNGYARKDNGFTTSANSLDSWYQEHMMSGGHGTNWPLGTGTCSNSSTSSSSSVPAYNWTRQKFDRFDVEPQGGGNYALVERLQAEQSRQRALVEQQLLAPVASELVLQVRGCCYFDYKYRAGLVVVDLGWVDFVLNVPPCCTAAQPIQPNSAQPGR